ncbi:hypothetical protein [Kitasatospora sp. NPDC058046]|uniref:hypothetical protein n=1 Tax=Kitasatospora sp. NPDC058046 TaxID=3346312 RepID=UPI0036DB23AA
MTALLISRGTALLAEDSPACAEHIVQRVAEANPGFSRAYVHLPIREWADVTPLPLPSSGEPYLITADMEETAVAAKSMPRIYPYMGTLRGGRLSPTEHHRYETPRDLVRTRITLRLTGHTAHSDVRGV